MSGRAMATLSKSPLLYLPHGPHCARHQRESFFVRHIRSVSVYAGGRGIDDSENERTRYRCAPREHCVNISARDISPKYGNVQPWK